MRPTSLQAWLQTEPGSILTYYKGSVQEFLQQAFPLMEKDAAGVVAIKDGPGLVEFLSKEPRFASSGKLKATDLEALQQMATNAAGKSALDATLVKLKEQFKTLPEKTTRLAQKVIDEVEARVNLVKKATTLQEAEEALRHLEAFDGAAMAQLVKNGMAEELNAELVQSRRQLEAAVAVPTLAEIPEGTVSKSTPPVKRIEAHEGKIPQPVQSEGGGASVPAASTVPASTASAVVEGTSGSPAATEIPPSKEAGPALAPEGKPPATPTSNESQAPRANEAQIPNVSATAPSLMLAKLEPDLIKMEAKLVTINQAHQVQAIRRMAVLEDTGKILGMEEWSKAMVNRNAKQILHGIGELETTEKLTAQIATDPGKRIRISSETVDLLLEERQANGIFKITEETEVTTREEPIRTHSDFWKPINHAADKNTPIGSIQNIRRRAVIRIKWPPAEPILWEGGSEKIFNQDGFYVIRNPATHEIYKSGSLVSELIDSLGNPKGKLPNLDRLSAISFFDEQNKLIWNLEKVVNSSTGVTEWIQKMPQTNRQ